MKNKINFWNILVSPKFIVGTLGSVFLFSMIIPECYTCNKFILGVLLGMVTTIIGFYFGIKGDK